jgi:hypothetical protein
VDAAPFDEARGEPAPTMGVSNVYQIGQAPSPPSPPGAIEGPPPIERNDYNPIDDDIPF